MFEAIQAVEWQCRYVFPEKVCCVRPIGHDGEHSPAVFGEATSADARILTPEGSQASGSATDRDLHAGEQLALAMLKAAKAEIAHLTEERNDIAAMREDLAAEIDRLHDQLAALTEVHERLTSGVKLIAAERARQMSGEGWTAAHDATHRAAEMVAAACCYAALARRQVDGAIKSRAEDIDAPSGWPWDYDWWKPNDDPIRNLVKAGALIAAEIDRLSALLSPREGTQLALTNHDPDQQIAEPPLPCQRCGGPHRFDTSVPSVEWNRVIRRARLPEFLCTTCIIEAFAMKGVSFTASLHGEEFSGLLIEVQINSQPARTAEMVQQENNALRCTVRELEEALRRARAEGPARFENSPSRGAPYKSEQENQ